MILKILVLIVTGAIKAFDFYLSHLETKKEKDKTHDEETVKAIKAVRRSNISALERRRRLVDALYRRKRVRN